MDFETFDRVAHEMWEEIPPEYRRGIDGLVVRREAEAHPEHDDYWTLGMCYTEPYPSGYMGPETTRSFLALYHGSFRNVAQEDPDFDWEGELWETITHELRHHLEFLAEDEALERVDYAMEEAYKRARGMEFDPFYYQSGEEIAEGVFAVEEEVYVEQRWGEERFADRSEVEFEWRGERYAFPRPAELGDVHYVWIEGVPVDAGALQIVLVREIPFLERIRRFLRRERPDLLESEARAEPRSSGGWP